MTSFLKLVLSILMESHLDVYDKKKSTFRDPIYKRNDMMVYYWVIISWKMYISFMESVFNIFTMLIEWLHS
jgi:hypothetical protein